MYNVSGDPVIMLVTQTKTNYTRINIKTGKEAKAPSDYRSIQFQMERPRYSSPIMIRYQK